MLIWKTTFRKKYEVDPASVSYKYKERWLWRTEEEFRKENRESAENYVLNLVSRTRKKVGEITDWGGIYLDSNGYSLNGWVKGTKGEAILETIIAGGYNIQRLHLRTLVK